MPEPSTWRTPVSVRLRHEALPLIASPAAALDALARQPLPVMLDSSALDARYGRYSVLACRPSAVVKLT